MAEAGVPESTMLSIMGHMSRAMLERYSPAWQPSAKPSKHSPRSRKGLANQRGSYKKSPKSRNS